MNFKEAQQVNGTTERLTTFPHRAQGPGQFRVNPAPTRMPYFLRRVLTGHPSTVPFHTPSPVAEPLSQMAQLAAGMLPLSAPGGRCATPPRLDTPRSRRKEPTPIEITPTPAGAAASLLYTLLLYPQMMRYQP